MQTLSSTQLEAIAFQRLENNNFINGEVDYSPAQGVYTGYFQITSDIAIDFTDSKFCLTDEGEKIADISRELETAVEQYLNENFRSDDEDDFEYEFADHQRKFNQEN